MRRVSAEEWAQIKENNNREEILSVLERYVAEKPGRKVSGTAMTQAEKNARYRAKIKAQRGKA